MPRHPSHRRAGPRTCPTHPCRPRRAARPRRSLAGVSATPETLLHDDLLERFRERASRYDRENAFFDEDLAELREAGYLTALVPGGARRTRLESRRRGARARCGSPARRPRRRSRSTCTSCGPGSRRCSATGATTRSSSCSASRPRARSSASASARRATTSCCSARARPPNRSPTAAIATPGRKIFTSLSPAWTRLGTMGLDTASADGPKIVYGFIDREDPDVRILDDWDTMGMRASQSRTTVLDGAFAAPDRIVRRLDPGPNADPLIFGIFASFELLLAVGVRRHRRSRARPRGRGGAPAHLDEDRRRARSRRIPTSAGASPMPRSRRTRSNRSSSPSRATSTRSSTTAPSGSRSSSA